MKTIFITGISYGLGLRLTSHYLRKGYRVIGISRTMSPELNTLKNEYASMLKWHQFDLGNIFNMESRLQEAIYLNDEKIDVFIDNAAILYKELIHRIKADEMAKMVTINTVAPIIVTKMILNNFLRYKTKGIIVHISSICAHRSFYGLSMIGATKAAIETFSQDTAYEYGRFGIRSNTVVLGLMEIGMRSTVNDRLTKDLKSMAALGQLIDTESVVNTIDYLTSEKSYCITGEKIHIDAGIL
jgi:Dehydrogenases with different specificities (related to short-chain alcohol dehydrogenases)